MEVLNCIFCIYILFAVTQSSFAFKHDFKAGWEFGNKKHGRYFMVDYEEGIFVKDSVKFRYVSGGVHYFRVLPHYWRDRLQKTKACGLDAIEMYIPWNFHQMTQDSYDFKGRRNLVKFIEIAQEEDLLVIVRGFPYSDSEWDMGGLPFWLLRSDISNSSNPIKLRSKDPRFIAHMYNWFNVLMPKLKPLLYENGGPIIMVQIENEYGSISNDHEYLNIVYNIARKFLGDSVVYFTTDGNNDRDLNGGRINGTLQTCDFGPGALANKSFAALVRKLNNGPYVNSEFYTGWLDHWGENHHRVASNYLMKSFNSILNFNASINFYMFLGGTNFEYWAGSNYPYHQITTSYDYDAPLSECGDTTTKYFQIRDRVLQLKNLPNHIHVPANVTKQTYGPVQMTNIGNVFQYLKDITKKPVESINPLTYEDLNVLGGFVMYETILPRLSTRFIQLTFLNGIKDFGQIFLNRESYIGEVQPGVKFINITLPDVKSRHTLSILVRSKGRVCFGAGVFDKKGITDRVLLLNDHQEYELQNWIHYPIKLEDFYRITLDRPVSTSTDQQPGAVVDKYEKLLPSLFVGSIQVCHLHDTFIDMSDGGWISGYVVINGFNLGYYEPKSGPQLTLYAPLPGIFKELRLDLNSAIKSVNVFIFESMPKYKLSNVFLTEVPNIG